MIKAVYFDLGNVILPVDGFRMANVLTRYCKQTPDRILESFWNHHIIENFEMGKVSPADFFAHIKTSCDITNLTLDEFVPIFNDIFDEDKRVSTLVTQIKKTCKLGLISNTNAIHVAHLLKTYPIMQVFDHLWLSNEVGVRKPDPAIYKMAISKFGVEPSETVFIDDLSANIDSANAVGMNGIHYQNYVQLVQDLKKLGVMN